MRMNIALRSAIFLLAFVMMTAVPTAQAGSASQYVQDGLLACWDGFENAGADAHDASATVWKDLVAGREFNLYNVTVEDDSMVFAGTQSSYGELDAVATAATFGSAANGMVEIVYASADGYKQKPDIKWNFAKFLINKKGQVVARFEPTESIDNIAKQIEELLK